MNIDNQQTKISRRFHSAQKLKAVNLLCFYIGCEDYLDLLCFADDKYRAEIPIMSDITKMYGLPVVVDFNVERRMQFGDRENSNLSKIWMDFEERINLIVDKAYAEAESECKNYDRQANLMWKAAILHKKHANDIRVNCAQNKILDSLLRSSFISDELKPYFHTTRTGLPPVQWANLSDNFQIRINNVN